MRGFRRPNILRTDISVHATRSMYHGFILCHLIPFMLTIVDSTTADQHLQTIVALFRESMPMPSIICFTRLELEITELAAKYGPHEKGTLLNYRPRLTATWPAVSG
jgi:hypothetical protein